MVYFVKWRAADPGFYSMNLMMTGKTYMRMKDNDRAIEYLTKTRDYPVRTEDDKKVPQVLCLHTATLVHAITLSAFHFLCVQYDRLLFLCHMSVTLCTVAKRYILQRKCLKNWIVSTLLSTRWQLTTPRLSASHFQFQGLVLVLFVYLHQKYGIPYLVTFCSLKQSLHFDVI